MEEDATEGKLFISFERFQEFLSKQEAFLSLDLKVHPSDVEDRKEIGQLQKLLDILNEYQEQAYLLDPYLEQLVPPVTEKLKTHARISVTEPAGHFSSARARRVTLLLYQYVKCRGYKTIIRFFPHEIADLSIALDYVRMKDSMLYEPLQWSMRYLVILWLSLICMIPFDLAQFDESAEEEYTANAIESVALDFLGKSGLERDGAAILLSRLYMRKDTASRCGMFLRRSKDVLHGPLDLFASIGSLQVLCEFLKSGSVEQVQIHLTQIFSIVHEIEEKESFTNNTLVRKFRIKLLSRVALRLLPAKRVHRKVRNLTGTSQVNEVVTEDVVDVPDEVETVLEDLFKGLQDKDTVVRWSAAKGIARISERLPADFSEQVLDNIISLFSIHSIAAANLYDLPAIAESTWHGACLACAELARRGLVAQEKLADLISWLSKALYFDIRKGAHSIGSNVRDAAAYVLWALARAQEVSALKPHASDLAQKLVTVALYDREIHIRRAASAAYQEHVGRMGLFPHGIDILRKTDFYAISVRRNAFLVAAPQVAEHIEYRSALVDHLVNVTLRHWDPSMRRLGAQSLRILCEPELVTMGPEVALKAARLLATNETADIHGGLLVLIELAAAYRDSEQHDQLRERRREIFKYLSTVPGSMIQFPRYELITEATCYSIANSISLEDIQATEQAAADSDSGPRENTMRLQSNNSAARSARALLMWREIIEYGLRHKKSTVQEAAAVAMAAVSKLIDCSAMVISTLTQEFSTGSPTVQQSLGRFLGVLDYGTYPHELFHAVQCLLSSVDRTSSTRMSNVEARRNCFLAMPQILSTVMPNLADHLSPKMVCDLFDALLQGLDDYTIDERGDVGSWIRIVCIQGLESFSKLLLSNADSIPNISEYLPPAKYHDAIGGILKQGVERLDNVRHEAGECFLRLLQYSPIPSVLWRVHGEILMRDLFLSETDAMRWSDGSWLYPKAVRLLEIETYRHAIMLGLIMSVGSKTDSTQRAASSSLVAYVQELPLSAADSDSFSALDLVGSLIEHVKANVTSNAAVVPTLHTLCVLLEADTLERLAEDSAGLQRLQDLLGIITKNISRIKNVQRIDESMKICINLLSFPDLVQTVLSQLVHFLAHRFPKIRADTAEYLYLALQSKDLGIETEEAESVLLETEWSSSDAEMVQISSQQVVTLLSS